MRRVMSSRLPRSCFFPYAILVRNDRKSSGGSLRFFSDPSTILETSWTTGEKEPWESPSMGAESGSAFEKSNRSGDPGFFVCRRIQVMPLKYSTGKTLPHLDTVHTPRRNPPTIAFPASCPPFYCEPAGRSSREWTSDNDGWTFRQAFQVLCGYNEDIPCTPARNRERQCGRHRLACMSGTVPAENDLRLPVRGAPGHGSCKPHRKCYRYKGVTSGDRGKRYGVHAFDRRCSIREKTCLRIPHSST